MMECWKYWISKKKMPRYSSPDMKPSSQEDLRGFESHPGPFFPEPQQNVNILDFVAVQGLFYHETNFKLFPTYINPTFSNFAKNDSIGLFLWSSRIFVINYAASKFSAE